MSTTIKSVAIAGASGSLGTPITKALLEAGFTVTALTRPDSKSTFPSGVKVSPVDYTSKSSLQTALQGHDALISTLASMAAGHQIQMIEAAVAAGVKRIIPAEFGSNTMNPRTRALPVFKDKVEAEELLQRLCGENERKTTYTLVLNSAFLDWGIDTGFLIDAKNKTYELMDGGNRHFTTTPLSFIAAGVVAILQRPDATANKAIYLQGARLTQRKFLEIVQRVVGSESWTVSEVDSQQLEKGAYEALQANPANVPGWVFPMLKLSIYAEGFGGDFGEQGERDNEMLGLKTLTEGEVESVVKGVVGGK